MVNNEPGKTLPATKPILLVAASLLAVMVGASVWIYFQGIHALRVQANEQGVLKQMEEWALKGVLATTAGGAGMMLAMVLGAGWLRRNWKQTADNLGETARLLAEANLN